MFGTVSILCLTGLFLQKDRSTFVFIFVVFVGQKVNEISCVYESSGQLTSARNLLNSAHKAR